MMIMIISIVMTIMTIDHHQGVTVVKIITQVDDHNHHHHQSIISLYFQNTGFPAEIGKYISASRLHH